MARLAEAVEQPLQAKTHPQEIERLSWLLGKGERSPAIA